jgi:hypothetical protein
MHCATSSESDKSTSVPLELVERIIAMGEQKTYHNLRWNSPPWEGGFERQHQTYRISKFTDVAQCPSAETTFACPSPVTERLLMHFGIVKSHQPPSSSLLDIKIMFT